MTWLPLLVVPVLLGLALGWWATVLALVPLVVLALVAARAVREIRDRPEPDRELAREELKELDRRVAPWIRAWAFGILGFTALFVVLLVVARVRGEKLELVR